MSEGARNLTPTASVPPENQDACAQVRFLWLPVTAIRPYDRNPRRTENPERDRIMASIRAERLEALPALEVAVAASQQPYRTQLRFANPYAFRGARLLGRYDELARGVLTARHVGLMENNEAERLLGRCAGKIRGLFCLPQGYRFLSIDREALTQRTAKAEQACETMGEVPEDVLSGDTRAALAPRKTSIQGPIPSNLKLHPVAPRSFESQAPELDVAGGNADG